MHYRNLLVFYTLSDATMAPVIFPKRKIWNVSGMKAEHASNVTNNQSDRSYVYSFVATENEMYGEV